MPVELEVVILDKDRHISDEQIMEMATIYRKETNRLLSTYQKRMNDASQQLCLQNPGLLQTIEAAREKVIAGGFQFVKGNSRSKKLQNEDDQEPVPKRPKLSQSVREKRIKEIKEDLRDLNDKIEFRHKKDYQLH